MEMPDEAESLGDNILVSTDRAGAQQGFENQDQGIPHPDLEDKKSAAEAV